MSEKRKVTVDGEEFEVDIERDGETWKVRVGGREFSIQVDSGVPGEVTRRSTGRGRRKNRSGTISSSIPGKVVSLHAAVGDRVEEGEVLLILEAMKMQNEIQAPIPGTVSEVNCESGDSVEANAPLVIIEPFDESV
ncbi:MAG: biotin/lipoyl-binding protein [Candidatus Poseidoniales archaeon]|jgi:biotin carboxyl carrier protein|uniref:Pyruvate carboxylase subunit B (PycB) n=1 Tax=uncultured marine group II/III euryarchaeote SAT1000_18_C09 TaxID=1456564 RepID=A0A075I6U9_9EURY|nr:pyruvate carboxylase subunit B (pycB) [uncultured marine group II/III euryarchaeote SAT1000_18_C09]MDE0706643.1 biotin/lipoyl-binding protein [Candidatus Poseidoniales archaeon]